MIKPLTDWNKIIIDINIIKIETALILIFENLKIFGKRLNINKIDLSYLTIKSIKDLYYNLSFNNLKKSFKEEIRNNKKDYQLNLNLKLPETISNISDIL